MQGDERVLDPDGAALTLREALARNADVVFRFLRRMSGDEERARDLTQDVMVKAIVGFRGFRGRSSFRTWLLAIAANTYRDDRKRKRPYPLEHAETLHDGGREADAMVRRLDAERVMDLVARLPATKRKAVILRLELGLEYQEIARVLECPVGTVRSRIHDAVEWLRRKTGGSTG